MKDRFWNIHNKINKKSARWINYLNYAWLCDALLLTELNNLFELTIRFTQSFIHQEQNNCLLNSWKVNQNMTVINFIKKCINDYHHWNLNNIETCNLKV